MILFFVIFISESKDILTLSIGAHYDLHLFLVFNSEIIFNQNN